MKKMLCAECGKSMSKEAKFCGGCGNKIEQEVSSVSPDSSTRGLSKSQNPFNNNIVAGAVGFLVVLAIGIGGFLLWNSMNDEVAPYQPNVSSVSVYEIYEDENFILQGRVLRTVAVDETNVAQVIKDIMINEYGIQLNGVYFENGTLIIDYTFESASGIGDRSGTTGAAWIRMRIIRTVFSCNLINTLDERIDGNLGRYFEFSHAGFGITQRRPEFDAFTNVSETPMPQVTPTQGEAVRVGDIIHFGGHNWRVLDVQDGRALIISENIIERRAYHAWDERITWEHSTLRHYLNNEFLNSFNATDRARITETRVINNNNPWFGTNGGNDTTDRIFLLSLEEVVRYFGNSGRLANQNHPNNENWGFHDQYNTARVARERNGNDWFWWLRSPSYSGNTAAIVGSSGSVGVGGGVDLGIGGVRPALWLNL